MKLAVLASAVVGAAAFAPNTVSILYCALDMPLYGIQISEYAF